MGNKIQQEPTVEVRTEDGTIQHLTAEELYELQRQRSQPSPWMVTCTYCGWSCRCATYGLAVDEARDHEQVCPDCSTEIREVTR